MSTRMIGSVLEGTQRGVDTPVCLEKETCYAHMHAESAGCCVPQHVGRNCRSQLKALSCRNQMTCPYK